LLTAVEGDPVGAVRLLSAAADRFAHLGLPLERGRTLLAVSQVERRRRRRAAARTAAREAADLFDRLDAHPWSRVASAALNRLERPKAPASRATLTDAESRLAHLVGQGATNLQAAATLCVSVKTVEATLTRVYRKLGLHSRAQLMVHLAKPVH
ncbi:MAG: helix-turn-helix transcriptional regulator, partial [Actinomycetota bacterium]|nr:helix-turn-helix transcriptional regulator [Actinomycetota bacterium]